MEHVKELLHIDELIEAIDDEIELAEEHLERALEFSHNPKLAHEFIAAAEEKHARAEKFLAHGKTHTEEMKARGMHDNPHGKVAIDLWCHKHEDLCRDIDELKHYIDSHKKRMSGGSRY